MFGGDMDFAATEIEKRAERLAARYARALGADGAVHPKVLREAAECLMAGVNLATRLRRQGFGSVHVARTLRAARADARRLLGASEDLANAAR